VLWHRLQELQPNRLLLPSLPLRGGALADRLDHRIELNVVGVVGLELRRDAGEGAFEGLLGGGVDHLGLGWAGVLVLGSLGREREGTYHDASIIGGPGDEGDFVSGGKG